MWFCDLELEIGDSNRSRSICVRGFLGAHPVPHFQSISLSELGVIWVGQQKGWLDDRGHGAKPWLTAF